MKLTIEVTTGNAAMQEASEAMEAILNIFDGSNGASVTFREPCEGGIYDYNGNRVGKWEVVED